jgi:predicted dehydrogenase
MKQRARYGIVGSGWRSDFFLRLAALMPERFEVTGLVTRSADKGAALSEKWKIPTSAARRIWSLGTGQIS